MKTPKIKMPALKDVLFELEIEEEDIPVRGNAMASGDDAADREVEDEIISRLNSGDLWAWCTVKVTARWKDFEGVDYLGACSYRDESDFCQPGGYFEDMKHAALDDLRRNIRGAVDRVAPLIECE